MLMESADGVQQISDEVSPAVFTLFELEYLVHPPFASYRSSSLWTATPMFSRVFGSTQRLSCESTTDHDLNLLDWEEICTLRTIIVSVPADSF